MATLPATIDKAVAAAAQLKALGKSNEANTRSHLIDPVLAALGWDLFDLTAVDREYGVYDGTVLDYALLVDGKPRVFVEAKALGKPLNDPKFVSQTVNYANNEGVTWCVLTDGLRYRVFKANESVAMERKLLFEANLSEVADGRMTEVIEALQRIGHEWVATGRLAEWAERIFNDIRVREALKTLIANPPNALYAGIESEMDAPVPSREQIRKSLQSIVAGAAKVPRAYGAKASDAVPAAGKGTGPAPQASKVGFYLMEHHTEGKPANIIDLFEGVTAYARERGGDVTEKVAKMTVNYFAGKRAFCSVKSYSGKVVVFLVLEPASVVQENPAVMRDLTAIGHHGNGHVEYSLTSAAQLDELHALIHRAYQAAQ